MLAAAVLRLSASATGSIFGEFLFDSGIFVFIKPASKRTTGMLSNIFNENTGEDSMWIIRGHEPRERTSRHWH